jgi:glycosyltransferase involved in cell wall biosynthesis
MNGPGPDAPARRPRVLFLVSRDWTHPQATGGDVCTCDYARYLAARGCDITLIAAHYAAARRQEMLYGVRVLRPGGLPLLALHAAAYYLRHRNEFDAVFEEGMASVRLPFLAPLYVRRPLLSVFYQVNAEIFAEQYSRPVARAMTFAERAIFATHRRAAVVALTEDRKRDLVAAGIPERRITVVPPLMLELQDAPPPGAAPREPLIAWIGKVRRYKRPDDAIRAMPAIVARVPDARLVIAGRRDDVAFEDELRDLAARLGVAGHVELRLNITEDEKTGLLQRAKALAVTSPVEGFSIVIIEANRCGTPVVATEGVPHETAHDGYNALRVPFGDAAALSSALLRILEDGALFETLSRNARDHASTFAPRRAGATLERALSDATRLPMAA